MHYPSLPVIADAQISKVVEGFYGIISLTMAAYKALAITPCFVDVFLAGVDVLKLWNGGFIRTF